MSNIKFAKKIKTVLNELQAFTHLELHCFQSNIKPQALFREGTPYSGLNVGGGGSARKGYLFLAFFRLVIYKSVRIYGLKYRKG